MRSAVRSLWKYRSVERPRSGHVVAAENRGGLLGGDGPLRPVSAATTGQNLRRRASPRRCRRCRPPPESPRPVDTARVWRRSARRPTPGDRAHDHQTHHHSRPQQRGDGKRAHGVGNEPRDGPLRAIRRASRQGRSSGHHDDEELDLRGRRFGGAQPQRRDDVSSWGSGTAFAAARCCARNRRPRSSARRRWMVETPWCATIHARRASRPSRCRGRAMN